MPPFLIKYSGASTAIHLPLAAVNQRFSATTDIDPYIAYFASLVHRSYHGTLRADSKLICMGMQIDSMPIMKVPVGIVGESGKSVKSAIITNAKRTSHSAQLGVLMVIKRVPRTR